MGKVIHVSDELHARMKDYCSQEGVGLKKWADEVLAQAVTNKAIIPPSRGTPVEKKSPSPGAINAPSNGSQSWELPPFWQRRGDFKIGRERQRSEGDTHIDSHKEKVEGQLEEEGEKAPEGARAPVDAA